MSCCSVHERFCLAAARGDQVAEASSSNPAGASSHQPEDTAPRQTVVTYIPAPDKPPESESGAEVSARPEAVGLASSMGRNAAAVAAGEGPTASGSQSGGSPESQISNSVLRNEEQDRRAIETEAKEEDNKSAGASSFSTLEHLASQEQPEADQGRSDELTTDPADGNTGRVADAECIVSQGYEGRSERPIRMPLAAVQEGAAAMLGSLSFKQAPAQIDGE